MKSVCLSPLSGSSSDGDKQNLSSSPGSDGVCVVYHLNHCPSVALSTSSPVSTKVVGVRLLANRGCCGAKRSRHFFGKIMGRLEDRETGVWADERWAPQLQRVTKQPPSLLVSDSLV